VLPEWTSQGVHKRCLPGAITRIQLCNPHPLRSTSHTFPLPTNNSSDFQSNTASMPFTGS
jgi:hypothetical protein